MPRSTRTATSWWGGREHGVAAPADHPAGAHAHAQAHHHAAGLQVRVHRHAAFLVEDAQVVGVAAEPLAVEPRTLEVALPLGHRAGARRRHSLPSAQAKSMPGPRRRGG